MFGKVELLLILLVILLVMFNGETLPKLARSTGKSVRRLHSNIRDRLKNNVKKSDTTA
ncbi:MAG TPA: twin-arginine translocase TatA/TatE family subunit [Candidatus Saccharimonadia bacterium]|jgi:Sec-independent protein translocase protein TatA